MLTNKSMLRKAAYLSKLCELAYKDKAYLTQKIEKKNVTTFKWFESSMTQAFLFYDSFEIILVFCGTKGLYDSPWLNVAVSGVQYQNKNKIHLGFALAADSIYNEIITYIASNNLKGRITCTGHSRGAAIATIIAHRIKAEELFTFGSPKVGNANFCDTLEAIHYRFINNNDIVTMLPLGMYKHSGYPIYLNYYGELRGNSPLQRIKDFKRGKKRARRKEEPFTFRFDHSISLYRKKIKNVCIQS